MQGVNGIVVSGYDEVVTDNKIHFLILLCCVRVFKGREVEDKVYKIIFIKFYTRFKRWMQKLLGYNRMDVVLSHDLAHLVRSGRFKIHPSYILVLIACNHGVSIIPWERMQGSRTSQHSLQVLLTLYRPFAIMEQLWMFGRLT